MQNNIIAFKPKAGSTRQKTIEEIKDYYGSLFLNQFAEVAMPMIDKYAELLGESTADGTKPPLFNCSITVIDTEKEELSLAFGQVLSDGGVGANLHVTYYNPPGEAPSQSLMVKPPKFNGFGLRQVAFMGDIINVTTSIEITTGGKDVK